MPCVFLLNRLHKQCEELVAALANKEVCTRDRLLAAWEQDSKCEDTVEVSVVSGRGEGEGEGGGRGKGGGGQLYRLCHNGLQIS